MLQMQKKRQLKRQMRLRCRGLNRIIVCKKQLKISSKINELLRRIVKRYK
jgi:hypothetical protein